MLVVANSTRDGTRFKLNHDPESEDSDTAFSAANWGDLIADYVHAAKVKLTPQACHAILKEACDTAMQMTQNSGRSGSCNLVQEPQPPQTLGRRALLDDNPLEDEVSNLLAHCLTCINDNYWTSVIEIVHCFHIRCRLDSFWYSLLSYLICYSMSLQLFKIQLLHHT